LLINYNVFTIKKSGKKLNKPISQKQVFKSLLDQKGIILSEQDFNEAYLSYRNFRKTYSELMKENFRDFEPRQRTFGELNE
tara:strand:- start:764 stop:1006 length:243 start_codon:yes stop_codon:yes gene_type:complete